MKRIISFLILSLALCVNVFAQDETFRKNIMIVFDASGSMGESLSRQDTVVKLVAAKSALKQVLQNTDPNTNVGLFVFGNVRNDYPYPIGPVDRARLYSAIDEINYGGGTPLGEYMQKAANKLLEQRAKQFGYGSYKLLVVTDGEAGDYSLMAQVAPEVLKRGVTLDVIGVGMTQAHQLAKMSSSYRAANDSKALRAAIVAVVAETSSQDGGKANTEDYDLISGVTDDQAKDILTCITSTTQNQPLFEIAEPPQVQAPASSSSMTAYATSPSSDLPISVIFVFVGVIIVIILLVLIHNS